MPKLKKLNYKKANRLLQDKQCELFGKIPLKYQKFCHQAISAEYVLTMLEEGHEAETYEYEILEILNS